ncbi:hypothetical protein HZC21_05350 [Candidatus Peregrinibacteria bacterium]|nr:hypothetical protein [Candidatus Peregrinibacteria bacterium]
MSDFEFFRPGEAGESYDPAAFERFKQQMKANAAFVAAARKSEQKQKEKEDKLAKILLKFIQTNQKSGILMLASKLMEENVPPSFILAIILLGNEEIQAELKREIVSSLAQIEAPEAETEKADIKSQIETEKEKILSEFSLAAKFENPALSLKVKAEIDMWGKSIFEAGSGIPFRVLETALDREGNIKKVVVDCTANVLDDYLASNNMPQVEYDTCFSFCEFLMRGIMQALKKQIENQKELK